MTSAEPVTPQQFADFAAELEAFAAKLPNGVRHEFVKQGDFVSLTIEPPTPAHRKLVVAGDPNGLEDALGKVWSEPYQVDAALTSRVLAACDALRDGRVREVRDRRTGLIYHLYRLRSRGRDEYLRDSQYSLWHWLRLRVRKVAIHSFPRLGHFPR